MTCHYVDAKGWCTGRLEGFACVGNKCCDHPKYPEKREYCTDKGGKGAYCHRYNKFFCAGKNHCSDQDYYLRMMRLC